MKRHLRGPTLLALLALAPIGVVACHHSSSGSSGGAQPASTGEQVTSADNEGGADPNGGGGGEGGSPRAHAPKDHDAAATSAAPTPRIVINKPTPEPLAPPAVAKAPELPALPNLPHPSKYKPAPVPKGPDFEECGQTWTGNEWVQTECIDPGAHKKDAAKAAQVVVPYDKMKAQLEALPKMVDHRADGTEGPVRHQGGPQCTAFAFTSALDHAYARWTGQPGDFSVMQVWARYHQKQEHLAADNNVGDSLTDETEWPYDGKIANSWMGCPKDGKKKPDQVCSQPVDTDKLRSLEAKAIAEITQIEVIPTSQTEVIREKLAAGQDVTLAIHMQSYATAGEPGAKYMVGMAKNPDAKLKGGHQVLLAGYADTPNGMYYLVHNSWGPKWGDAGYAWLHEDLIKTYWIDSIVVVPDVEPKAIAARRLRAHGKLTEKCEKGKVPDSISGICAGKCPDGSPRHNNVCAATDKKDCPAGMVNLTGECLLAAPKSSGIEEKTHVKWECGPGGCAYDIPKDKLDCKEHDCAVSCPAPSFRLATLQKGLACVE